MVSLFREDSVSDLSVLAGAYLKSIHAGLFTSNARPMCLQGLDATLSRAPLVGKFDACM